MGLQKLAGVLSLDAGTLTAQFEDLQPIARRHSEAGHANHVAWRMGVQDVMRNAKTRASHPCDVLTAALARHVAWNASTAAVERDFGKAYCSTAVSRSRRVGINYKCIYYLNICSSPLCLKMHIKLISNKQTFNS